MSTLHECTFTCVCVCGMQPPQNGRWLTPDHGFPVRIIIPGFIGGRMVKWLEEITVTETESQNHYHFFDNRVLPSHVDQDLANKEGTCDSVCVSVCVSVCECVSCPHTSPKPR